MRYLGGINSPSYNPLASNVTTGVTTVQAGGIYTTTSAAQAIPNQQWLSDPYFQDNILLLQADNAANAYQNNTFLDASENNLAVFRNGNPTQGTFSPFSQASGYWCNTFDGTGDYLSVASTIALGTNDFTIEMFFWATTLVGFLYDGRTAATQAAPTLFFSGSSLIYYVNGANRITSGTVLTGQWYHLVVSRVSGNTRMFLNGVQSGSTYVDATNYISNTNRPFIGNAGSGTSYFNGMITNLRVVNGSGVTSVTVPTAPLENITNTQLLTCRDSRYLDDSSSFPITAFGNPACRPTTPFYNPQFSSYNNLTPSYGSVYFPSGTVKFVGSTISATTSTFTIECWINSTTFSSNQPEIFIEGTDANYYLQFGPDYRGKLGLYWDDVPGGYISTYGTTTLALNTWYHIAVSVASNNISFYVNGVRESIEGGVPIPLTNRVATANQGFVNGVGSYRGSVSNLSVLSGVAKYSGPTITVPTAPLPTSATGQVLLFARDGISDSNTTVAAKPVSIFLAGPTTSPASPFGAAAFAYPSAPGAMFFDGTGDYLNLGGPSQLAFGTNDFTIELWVYPTVAPVPPAGLFLYDSRPASTDGAYPCIFVAPTTNVLTYYVSTAARITGTTALPLGQWNYVVVSRVSGSTRMFLNGVQEGSTYTDSTTYLNGANRPVIANNGLNLTGTLTGYISNLRVLNGTGSTTSTIPTAPLTAVTNTDLLLNGTNAGIYDATEKSVLETVGNAQVSTNVKKYGSGSMYFDGTGDWLLIPHNADLNLGTGDFTVECWVNIFDTSAARHLIGKGTATTGWGISFNALPTSFVFNYANTSVSATNYNLMQRQWYHIAVTRAGSGTNNFRMFINGSLILQTTVTNDLSTTSNIYIGASRTGTLPMLGCVDDLRITNGYARYLSSFIPPTVALPRLGPL